jgi:acyl-CoA thioesterase FadM
MNLYFRLLKVFFTSLFRKHLEVFESSELSFTVLPHDIDLNLHLNNGRYLTLMDLGRIDFTIRSGLISACIKNRWLPVVSSVMIRYLKPIDAFQKFEIHTEVLCWDEKYVYMKQMFVRKGKTMAQAIIRGLFLQGKRKVAIRETINALGKPVISPAIPRWIKEWVESEEAMVGH